jgi:hypothetical protein
MKVVKTIVVLGATMVALAANEALAEKCNGHVISKPLKPILMREAPDGSKVQWFSSEGMFVVANPNNHPANLVNRVCGGGFKITPDGKSGSGKGSCSYADLDGDVFHLAWQSTFTEGTWEIVEGTGTGKFKNFSGQGIFRPMKRFENFWGGSTWEGECNLPK